VCLWCVDVPSADRGCVEYEVAGAIDGITGDRAVRAVDGAEVVGFVLELGDAGALVVVWTDGGDCGREVDAGCSLWRTTALTKVLVECSISNLQKCGQPGNVRATRVACKETRSPLTQEQWETDRREILAVLE
jgi:hypothetical protein